MAGDAQTWEKRKEEIQIAGTAHVKAKAWCVQGTVTTQGVLRVWCGEKSKMKIERLIVLDCQGPCQAC